MTTVILTAHPATGYNRLTITPTADVTRVRRTDANGTYDVRVLDGQLPHAAPDVLTLDDYEAAKGTSTYAVITTAGTVSGSIVLALTSPWLGTPETPHYSAPVASVLTYGAGVVNQSTVHEPDGAPAIVIVRGGSTRRGSMTIQGGSYSTALNLLRLCQQGRTMLLRETQHPGMDMFFMPMNADIITSLAAGAASQFDLSVQYIEVGRPTGPLAGAFGWTWDDVPASFDNWWDVFDAYANWADVRLDRRIN